MKQKNELQTKNSNPSKFYVERLTKKKPFFSCDLKQQKFFLYNNNIQNNIKLIKVKKKNMSNVDHSLNSDISVRLSVIHSQRGKKKANMKKTQI